MKIGTYFGNIFLPDSGRVIIDSARLNVKEGFFELEIPAADIGNRDREFLCGTFNTLGKLTLVNCTISAGQSGSGGKFITFLAEYCLNDHFEKNEDLIFQGVNVYMPALFQWLQIHSIHSDLLSDNPYVRIEEPDNIMIGEIDGFSLSFVFYYSFSSRYRDGEIQLREGAGLRIESIDKAKHLNEFTQIIINFRKLLYFFTNSSCRVESVSLIDEGQNSINLYTNNFRPFNTSTSFFRNFTYSNLKNDLQNVISRWFEDDEMLVSINLILEKSMNTGLSRENFFLNGCFALETLHRNFHDFKLITPKKFKILKEQLLKDLNPEDKEFIKNRMGHFNSPNFRQRLLHYKNDFALLLPPDIDAEGYITKIVHTRNFLVHRSSRKVIFDNFDLLYAAIYLEGMVKLQVLRLLGINEKIIQQEFKKVQEDLNMRYHFNKRREFR